MAWSNLEMRVVPAEFFIVLQPRGLFRNLEGNNTKASAKATAPIVLREVRTLELIALSQALCYTA